MGVRKNPRTCPKEFGRPKRVRLPPVPFLDGGAEMPGFVEAVEMVVMFVAMLCLLVIAVVISGGEEG